MKTLTLALGLLLVGGCSARDPLVGTFSATQIDQSPQRNAETLLIKVEPKGNGYSMSLRTGVNEWMELPERVTRCNFGAFYGTGAKPKGVEAIPGACIEGAKSGLFYLPDRDFTELAFLTKSDYVFFMAFPFGGTIWEARRE
jgi:hypothetical protein